MHLCTQPKNYTERQCTEETNHSERGSDNSPSNTALLSSHTMFLLWVASVCDEHVTHSNVLPKDSCFSFWPVTSLEVVDKVAGEHGVELQEEVVHASLQVQEEELGDAGCMGGREGGLHRADHRH